MEDEKPTAHEKAADLIARASSGAVLEGIPSTAELMRRRGLVLAQQGTAPVLAGPACPLGVMAPLQAGTMPARAAEAVLARVAELRQQALDIVRRFRPGLEAVNERARVVALAFPEYVQAVRNRTALREKLQRKVNLDGSAAFLTHEEPETLRFVGRIYDGFRHTPDLAGYLRYVEDVAPVYASCRENLPLPVLDEATREQHTYITGSPGMGKTELLKAMILNDVTQGNACVVIDPTGNLARAVAKWPEFQGEGSKRLAYFDPFLDGTLRPVLNPLDGSHLKPDEQEVLASQLTDVLAQVVGRGEWTPQANTLASNCFRVMAEMERPDLFFLWRALVGTDTKGNPRTEEAKELHRRGLQHPSKSVRFFFEIDFFDAQYAPTKGSLRAKIGNLTNNSTFVNAITGPSTFLLEREIEAKRTVIFNLEGWRDDGLRGPFGRLVLAQLVAMGMRRNTGGLPAGQKPAPVHVYVDEVSVFVSPAIVKILYRLRQDGIHLTMAQQTPGDGFEADAKKHLFADTAIKFAAGSGQKDMLAAMNAPPDALQGMKKGQFVGCWGHNAEPFRLTVRSDRADFTASMAEGEWEAVKADQLRRYYRATVNETPTLEAPATPSVPQAPETPALPGMRRDT